MDSSLPSLNVDLILQFKDASTIKSTIEKSICATSFHIDFEGFPKPGLNLEELFRSIKPIDTVTSVELRYISQKARISFNVLLNAYQLFPNCRNLQIRSCHNEKYSFEKLIEANCVHLTRLDLEKVHITDGRLRKILDVAKQLTEIELTETRGLIGLLDSTETTYPNVTDVILHNNGCERVVIPMIFTSFPNLQYLDMNCSQLTLETITLSRDVQRNFPQKMEEWSIGKCSNIFILLPELIRRVGAQATAFLAYNSLSNFVHIPDADREALAPLITYNPELKDEIDSISLFHLHELYSKKNVSDTELRTKIAILAPSQETFDSLKNALTILKPEYSEPGLTDFIEKLKI